MVTNSTAELTQLKIDKAVLKVHNSEQQDFLSTKPCHMEAVAGNLSYKPCVVSYKDSRVSNKRQKAPNLNTYKSSRTITSNIQNPMAAKAVAEFPDTEKNGFP